jgi:hypothetical protein
VDADVRSNVFLSPNVISKTLKSAMATPILDRKYKTGYPPSSPASNR